ncbi:HAD family hydrolase [Paenibacillus sp. CAA11]|uniref:HAD family hydrolase n=1 Tax=Paenibacillus sp. CAA11 TaxID=1532905 RepID=UPI000D3DAC95|nr:HAD hydrolase-like protein [Paenibacillus sp. CAA11]AWB46922.1 HAD family hydrolase [Paenibacillus sp. CAA11]
MDDTLVYCNKYFDQVLAEFANQLQEWFGAERLSEQDIRSKQIEIDVAGVHQIGFTSSHFPQSLVDTYRYFSHALNRPANDLEELRLTKLGLSVYEQKVEPYPGMVETLEILSHQGHELFLYTGGENEIQQRKIDQMKLSAYFKDRIYIRRHKNVQALEEILGFHSFDRNVTWMIGNSLRTDIEPALQAGINTIYIKRPDEWVYNMIELKNNPDAVMYTVSSLEEVPGIIAEHMSLKAFKRTL